MLAAHVAQSTTMSVTCSNTTPYNVATSTVTARLLANGAVTLRFQRYSNAGATTVWGNTIGTNTMAGTDTGNAQTLTIYGIVHPQLIPVAGTYTSTVTASVTF